MATTEEILEVLLASAKQQKEAIQQLAANQTEIVKRLTDLEVKTSIPRS